MRLIVAYAPSKPHVVLPLLRERIAEGVPAYFTYDPHWSDEGHAAVAAHLAATLFSGVSEHHDVGTP